MLKKQIIFSVVLVCLSLLGKGQDQTYLADVEFEKINEGAVEAYVYRQIENNIETFSDVKPSLTPESSTAGFCVNEREYILKDSLEKTWKHYLYTNPAKAWNAGKMDFGMLFSKSQNELYYPNQQVDRIEPGQLIYLNLNILKGIKKICTAFEITKVDDKTKTIEFSYLEDNQAHGKQQLQFVETNKGYTKIIHRSYFKSKSNLRDHLLYPYFHIRMTNNYHRNMKKMYKDTQLN